MLILAFNIVFIHLVPHSKKVSRSIKNVVIKTNKSVTAQKRWNSSQVREFNREQPLLYEEVIHHKLQEIIYRGRRVLYLSKSREKNQLAKREATADG